MYKKSELRNPNNHLLRRVQRQLDKKNSETKSKNIIESFDKKLHMNSLILNKSDSEDLDFGVMRKEKKTRLNLHENKRFSGRW